MLITMNRSNNELQNYTFGDNVLIEYGKLKQYS